MSKTTVIDVVEAIGTVMVAVIILVGSGLLLVEQPGSEAVITLAASAVGSVVGFFFAKQAGAQGAKTTNGTTQALADLFRVAGPVTVTPAAVAPVAPPAAVLPSTPTATPEPTAPPSAP